jgi:hypothetical protein
MIQILVTRDFDGQGEESRVITYGAPGYTMSWDNDWLPYAYQDKEVEDSFVGASMFGWDAPIAEIAHEWVAEMMGPDDNWSEQSNHTHEV